MGAGSLLEQVDPAHAPSPPPRQLPGIWMCIAAALGHLGKGGFNFSSAGAIGTQNLLAPVPQEHEWRLHCRLHRDVVGGPRDYGSPNGRPQL